METISCLPRPELRSFVRAYSQRRTGPGEMKEGECYPTRLEQMMRFEFGQPLVVGYPSRPRLVFPDTSLLGPIIEVQEYAYIPPHNDCFIVYFHPAGFSQLFGLPVCELTDQVHDGECVLGCQIRRPWEEMGEARSFQERVSRLERFLMQRLTGLAAPDVIQLSAAYLLIRQGTTSMAHLAERYEISLRQFERRFLAQVGLAPKQWARIARFQAALDMKAACPHRSWTEIAHALRYHDQMHLIHDFQTLGRSSPTHLFSKLGVLRQWATDVGSARWPSRSAA